MSQAKEGSANLKLWLMVDAHKSQKLIENSKCEALYRFSNLAAIPIP